MMKAQALREKSVQELVEMITDLKKERMSLRMSRSQGSDVKQHRFREIRRHIAKAMTVLQEKKVEAK